MAYRQVTRQELEEYIAKNPGAKYRVNGQEVQAPFQDEDKGVVMNLLTTLSKPLRTIAGGTYSAITGREKDNPFFTQREELDYAENPTLFGAKQAIGLGSYLLPVGAAEGATGLKAVGQAAKSGLLPGAMGGVAFSEQGKELSGALKGGVTGGLFAGTLQGLGEGVKAVKSAKIANKLDDMADELQASALKKDIGIAPTTKQGKNILPKEVLETANKMGVKIKNPEDLKTFGQALYESNANVANVAAQQLDDLGRAIDITDIKKPLLEQLAKTKSPELKAPIQKVLDSIDSATGGSNTIPASELLNLKREWGKLGNWNPLMDPAATTTAGAFEAAYIKANDLLDDAFKSAGITGFKEANKALSLAIDADNWADRAIANRANRPLWNDMTQDAAIAATVFGGGGPAAAAGAVGSKVMQRYAEPLAEGALRGASKVVGGASALPQVLQPILNAGQRAVPAVAGLRAGTQEVATQGVGTQPTYPTTQGVQQGMEAQGISPLNLMLAQEVLNGNISAAEANAVLSLLGMSQETGKLTEKQKLFKSAAQTAGEALAMLESGQAKTGKIQGVGTAVGKFFGTQAPGQTDYLAKLDGARMAAISALSGANVPPSEYERMRNLIPEPNDEYNIAVQKLRSFQQVMNNYAQSYGSDTSADTTGVLQTLGLQ
jgi:hypothetical protein